MSKEKINWFVRTFEVPIYWIDIVLVIHDDFIEIDKRYGLKLRDECDSDEDVNKAHAWTALHPEYNDKCEIYILIKPKWLNIDTFDHEMAHIMSYICGCKGIILDAGNDEPLAYLQGFLSKNLIKHIVKYMDDNKIDLRKFLLPA